MTKIRHIFDRLVDVFAVAAAICYIFILLSIAAGVVMRYFVRSPLLWVVETTNLALLYLTFCASVWLQRRDGHVKMDIIINRLNPIGKNILNGITSAICAAMFFIFTYYGVGTTIEHFISGSFATTSVMEYPDYYYLAVIPVASLFLGLLLLKDSWKSFRLRKQQVDL